MLQRYDAQGPAERAIPGDSRPELVLEDFNWRYLLRHVRLIALSVAVCLALGAAYITWRPAAYMAEAQLLVDHQVLQLLRNDSIYAASGIDVALLHNQVAILQSEALAVRVIEELNLANEETRSLLYVESPSEVVLGIFRDIHETIVNKTYFVSDRLLDALGYDTVSPRVTSAGDDPKASALAAFRDNLWVEAGARDHTIRVRFTALNPEFAARIVNELTRVYLEDQAEMNERAARAASGWLRERVAGLGTTTRVLAEARPPRARSGAGNGIVLAASALAGLSLGIAAAFILVLTNRRIRLVGDAEAAAGVECLGCLPWMRRRSRPTPVPINKDNNTENKRFIQRRMSSFTWAIDYPFSGIAHAINRLYVAAVDKATSQKAHCRAIGITAVGPQQGATVVAANLAHVMAKRGHRVLLIDADAYNRGLSRGLFAHQGPGLLEVLEQPTTIESAILVDSSTGLNVLPLSASAAPLSISELIWSNAMERFLQDKRHDYVIFDLPPLVPVADVVAAGRFLDRLVVVVEWENVTMHQLSRAVASAGSIQDKLHCVILNKAKTSRWQAFIDGELPRGRAFRRYINDRARANSP